MTLRNPSERGDRLCRGIFADRGVRAVFVRIGDIARMARVLHGLYPTSAHLFAQGLAAGALLGALQKDRGRINLQIECDGPLRGLLVDADAEGNVRGYVRSPRVHFPGDPEHGARAALGGDGTLSVLRDQGDGKFYQSAVRLEAFDLREDLRRWISASEQVLTAADLAIVPHRDEPLGEVAGLLLQRLPDGDSEAVEAARVRLASGALPRALAAGLPAQEIIREVAGEGFELLADMEVAYRCRCSLERVRVAVSALGPEGIDEVLANERQASVTCEFCQQHYVIAEDELRDIARRLREQAASG